MTNWPLSNQKKRFPRSCLGQVFEGFLHVLLRLGARLHVAREGQVLRELRGLRWKVLVAASGSSLVVAL